MMKHFRRFWLLLTVFCISSVSSFSHVSQQQKSYSTRATLLQSASQHQQEGDDQRISYDLEVSYEGRSCSTQVQHGETILAALERTGTADQLSMPSLPSDCRRGNCLTCVGMHDPHSDTRHLVSGDNGLSPLMAQETQRRGYILTCSSYIVGDGVKLQLGANQQAWDELYRQRFEDDTTKEAGRAAMARVIRNYDEEHVEEWKEETEEVLRKTHSSSDQ